MTSALSVGRSWWQTCRQTRLPISGSVPSASGHRQRCRIRDLEAENARLRERLSVVAQKSARRKRAAKHLCRSLERWQYIASERWGQLQSMRASRGQLVEYMQKAQRERDTLTIENARLQAMLSQQGSEANDG
jgi:regulator of replication initiation timing